MLVRPMLFPTTPMVSVSTNKIKIYTLFCYFKSEASSWFRFPQTTIKNILYYYYSCYHYYSYSYYYYFSFYFFFKSKASLCLRFSQTKIGLCFIFLPSPCFQFPQIEIKIYFIFYFKSKPSHKQIWLSPLFSPKKKKSNLTGSFKMKSSHVALIMTWKSLSLHFFFLIYIVVVNFFVIILFCY